MLPITIAPAIPWRGMLNTMDAYDLNDLLTHFEPLCCGEEWDCHLVPTKSMVEDESAWLKAMASLSFTRVACVIGQVGSREYYLVAVASSFFRSLCDLAAFLCTSACFGSDSTFASVCICCGYSLEIALFFQIPIFSLRQDSSYTQCPYCPVVLPACLCVFSSYARFPFLLPSARAQSRAFSCL